MSLSTVFDIDTIAAVATAPGRGGVGIIRISGPLALPIAESLSLRSLKPRFAHFAQFRQQNGTVLDSGIALFFPGPASFTGEDVTEVQAHGGPVILDLLLQECCHLGARLARAGEFSERAFLNNKIDLAQAEAIADLINSTTESAALGATRSLQGVFSNEIMGLLEAVTELRVYIEAAIDFPEEEVDFISEGQVARRLANIIEKLGEVHKSARQGSLMQEGMKLVIAGKPNAGKSSLLNALSGEDTAIVTEIEGTTRDVLRQHIQIDGMPLHIVDTAGLRDSGDEIEREGIRRAWREIESADRILLVLDVSAADDGQDQWLQTWTARGHLPERDIPVTVVENKCDVTEQSPAITGTEGATVIRLSAKTGAGLELLRRHLKACMGYEDAVPGQFSARRRHLQSLQGAAAFLEAGRAQLEGAGAGELLAEDLRQCQNCLGEITGAMTSDELLGEIFSSFCIGK